MSDQDPAPINVYIHFSQRLDAEAYAARINQELGWRAYGSTARKRPKKTDVTLSDICGKKLGDGPCMVLVSPMQPRCSCCQPIDRRSDWDAIFTQLAKLAGREEMANPRDEFHSLTNRELEVLCLVGEGNSVAQCAELLGVTPSTVGNHKYRLMRKLKANSSLQLMKIAVRHRLVDLG